MSETVQKDADDGSSLFLILEGQDLLCVGGWFGTTNPRIVISASVPAEGGAVAWESVHESEVIPNIREGSRPRWKEMIVSLHNLCKGALEKPIRIAVESLQEGESGTTKQSMGYLDTTVEDILKASGDPTKTAKLRDDSSSTGTAAEFGSLLVRHAHIQRPRLSAGCRKSIRHSMSWSVKKESKRGSFKRTGSGKSILSQNNRSSRRARMSLQDSQHSRASLVIPEDQLLHESSILRLTLEANLDPTGGTNNLTTLMENVVGDWGGTSIITPKPDEDEEEDWFGNFLGTTNPYFIISALSSPPDHSADDDSTSLGTASSDRTSCTPQGQKHQVCRSETSLDTVTPIWKSAVVPLYLLCGGNLERSFRVSFFSKRDGILGESSAPMGFFDTTILQIKRAAKQEGFVFVPTSKDGSKKYGTWKQPCQTISMSLSVALARMTTTTTMMMMMIQ